jgi:hypothetical protein
MIEMINKKIPGSFPSPVPSQLLRKKKRIISHFISTSSVLAHAFGRWKLGQESSVPIGLIQINEIKTLIT